MSLHKQVFLGTLNGHSSRDKPGFSVADGLSLLAINPREDDEWQ
jgi:hypothetical protein